MKLDVQKLLLRNVLGQKVNLLQVLPKQISIAYMEISVQLVRQRVCLSLCIKRRAIE